MTETTLSDTDVNFPDIDIDIDLNFDLNDLSFLLGVTFDETLTGGENNDLLQGGAKNEVIQGFDGDDTLEGLGGSDYLNPGKGDDLVNGGDGNDSLGDSFAVLGSGYGEGNDTLNGGDGDDEIDAGLDNDLLDGGKGHDSLRGGDGNDSLNGGEGDDVLSGKDLFISDGIFVISGGGYYYDDDGDDDILDGGKGNDSLYGEVGNDTLIGGEGNDFLSGGNSLFSNFTFGGWNYYYDPGNDYLEAGPGNDTLEGNGGSDTLIGGAGDDHFHFHFRAFYFGSISNFAGLYPPSGIDTIEDYNTAEGDQLIISASHSIGFDQLQYNSETGLLSYNGKSFAKLSTGLDFVPEQDIVLDISSPVYDSYVDSNQISVV